jgi:8-oxo-dGTP pyrophosphatase MutT (NUDIX family)
MIKIIIDRTLQAVFIAAYRVLKVYWFFRKPDVYGVYVALWCQDKILIIKNSYKRYYTLPSGSVKRREDLKEAAARELREETGIAVPAEKLQRVKEDLVFFENKYDHITIFELRLNDMPPVRPDNREVIYGEFLTIERTLSLDLFPAVKNYIEGI